VNKVNHGLQFKDSILMLPVSLRFYMKNIDLLKPLFSNKFFLIPLLIVAGYFFAVFAACVYIWVDSGFNPYALAIDSCLDTGGRWDEAARTCEKG